MLNMSANPPQKMPEAINYHAMNMFSFFVLVTYLEVAYYTVCQNTLKNAMSDIKCTLKSVFTKKSLPCVCKAEVDE